MLDRLKLILKLLSFTVFIIGCIFVVGVTALFYGGSSAARGGYQDAFVACIVGGILYFMVIKISCYRGDAVLISALAMAPIVFVSGHFVAYDDAHGFAWEYTHTIAPEEFREPEWQYMSRDENFRRYVGYVTGTPGDGLWAYMRLQSSVGATDVRYGKGASGRMEFTISGFFVWIAWIVHLVMLVVGFGIPAGAVAPNIRKKPTKADKQ